MEIRDIFWHLVSNQYIEGFNYADTRLAFRTVFYNTPYSYRSCPCAFIHEYVQYIADDGTVDWKMYKLIEQNIIDGRCPHVDGIPNKCVRETKVNAIHIAIASNNIEVASMYYQDYGFLPTKIFQLTPFRLALVRGNCEIVDIAQAALSNSGHFTVGNNLVQAKKIMFAYRNTHQGTLTMDYISTTLFCLRYKKFLLRRVLHPLVVHSDVDEALALSFKSDDTKSQDDILEYLNHMAKAGKSALILNCAICCIIYNKMSYLQKVLELLYSVGDVKVTQFQRMYTICKALQRKYCFEILKAFDDREPSKTDTFTALITLLSAYHADFANEIVDALRKQPDVYESINANCNDSKSVLQLYTGGYHPIAVGEIKSLIDAGADPDLVDEYGNTLLEHMLSKRVNFIGRRETLELLLYRNPDTDINKNAVKKAIELDIFVETNNSKLVKDQTGEFVLDAKEHTKFGVPNSSVYALDFVGPLLIECGLPYSRSTLMSALDEPMCEAELEYLRQCLDSPRPLKLQCRDILRKYFKNKSIHQFLERAHIPDRLKDFLLLKTELALDVY